MSPTQTVAAWVAVRSLEEVGGFGGLTDVEPSASMTIAVAITTVVGTFVSAGTQAPNWTRFARSGRSAVWACVIGFLVGTIAGFVTWNKVKHKERVRAFVDVDGGTAADSLESMGRACNVVITMLPDSPHVEDVVLGLCQGTIDEAAKDSVS